MRTPFRIAAATIVVAAMSHLAASDRIAEAATEKCRRAIVQANEQFVSAKTPALAHCEDDVVRGARPGPCPDAAAAQAIAQATAKLTTRIASACGGADRRCGGDLSGEDAPAALGWPAVCPNLEHGACTNAIGDCDGIAACLACVGEAAVDQAIALLYDDLVLPSTDDAAINRCQQTIGRATTAFLDAKSRALTKCWDARLRGRHGDDCVPPNAGDGRYLTSIAKAEAKAAAAICKACGGADRACGGAEDLSPIAIGFAPTCPAVTPPGGASCERPVATVQDLADCVTCVAHFEADCVDRLALSGLVAYPEECAGVAPPSTCPRTLELTADGPGSDLDIGWSGFAHDTKLPAGTRVTLAVDDCAGGTAPPCGACTLSGPIANAGGPSFDNQRCEAAPWIICADDGDCAGGGGACVFYLGAPLPSSTGGIPACILNAVGSAVTGTVDVDAGSLGADLDVVSRYHVGVAPAEPCPTCVAGTCNNGPRIGEPCTVMATGIFGNVSLDCPPSPGSNAGTVRTHVATSTGHQSVVLTVESPVCRGVAGKSCFCDTCNNANADSCMRNADCPPSGGAPGVCGGRRCLGGSNAGAPCSVASSCPGSACNRPGEPTRPNYCIDDTTTPIDGSVCVDLGGGVGECPEYPGGDVCSIQTFRFCTTDADCQAPACPDCVAGQTCRTDHGTPCFLDNGVIGGSVAVDGLADSLSSGTGRPAVGALFCVNPLAASSFNLTRGLPGLGRARVPLEARLGF